MKYIKKYLTVEAKQWFPHCNFPEVYLKRDCNFGVTTEKYVMKIDKREVEVFPGDYIITGDKEGNYPCNQQIFEDTYMPFT